MVKRHKSLLSPEHEKVGKRLAAAREALHLSQNTVARALHESQTWVSKIETGRRRVDAVELRRLVLLYKTDANSIVMPDYVTTARPRPRLVYSADAAARAGAAPILPGEVADRATPGPRGKTRRPTYKLPRQRKRAAAAKRRRPKG